MARGDGRQWALPAAVAAALCLVLSLYAGRGAEAHATLQRSVPADQAQLSTAPRQVDLFFAQQLEQNHTGTFAVVLNRTGQTVSDEATIDPTNGQHLVVPLHGGLDDGVYTVFWKTTSDDDGGVSLGSFSFFIGHPDQQTVADTAASGQVFVPDSARSRALSQPAPNSSSTGTLLAGLVLGGAAGLVVGGGAGWLLLRRRPPRAAPARATRPGRR
jgi:methionine-rich copper-binding protein CopC